MRAKLRGKGWIIRPTGDSMAAIVCLGSALLTGGQLIAAEVESTDTGQLQEIIVTAQRRPENLQNVPISAQVVGSEFLAEQNQNALSDLTQIVPGVHVGTNAISDDLFIRGIGSGTNASFDQSVAIFDDDIYHGRSKMSEATFLDLDRIELLKGPQSTFFGNNAIAGALNIVTKKPGDTFDASGRLLYGQFGQYTAEGAIGGPLTDTFGARLAVMRNGQSGWIDNVNTGEKAPDENNQAARLILAYKPMDALDVTLKIEGSRNQTSGTALSLPLQWANCPAPPPIGANFPGGYCSQALALGAAVPMGTNNNLNTGLSGQGASLSTVEDVLTLNYRQWGQTFTSVTGFYNYHADANVDDGNLPYVTLTNQIPEKYHQFSQELRVASPTGGAIEYLAGGYFQTDELDFDAVSNAPFLNPEIEAVPFLAPLLPYLPLSVAEGFSQNEHVYSVFGSLAWHLTENLRLNAGLRGSEDNKDVIGHVFYGTSAQQYGGFVQLPPAIEPVPSFLFGPAGTPALSRSDHSWMPSGGIQYQIVSYFTYSKGFKAGGINGQNGVNKDQDYQYAPETVNAYELGIKSKWFDQRVLLDLDLFRGDYRNLQVMATLYDPVAKFLIAEVGNAAKSLSQGVELESQWAVTREFRLSANVAYLESYYLSYPNAPPTSLATFNGETGSDLSGQSTQYAPRWSGSMNGSYTLSLPGDYRFTTQLIPYFTSSYFTQSGDPFYLVHAYTRLDGRLTLETPGGHWAFDVIGKNLTDRVIVSQFSGIYNQAKEEPRNIAVQFRFHW